MNKIIMIEGARNVGKTFLLNQLDNLIIYKFPFSKYFNELHTYNIEETKQQLNSDPKLFFLTLGYDITILDLASKGLLRDDLYVDRGILSDIVFGVQSGRINEEYGKVVLDWIVENYGQCFNIIYIYSDPNTDNRNKDGWDHYDKNETHELYLKILDENNLPYHKFKNNFDIESIDRFIDCSCIY